MIGKDVKFGNMTLMLSLNDALILDVRNRVFIQPRGDDVAFRERSYSCSWCINCWPARTGLLPHREDV